MTHLPAADLEEKARALRRQIVGAILPSGAAIYIQELEAERQRAAGLNQALQGRTRALRRLWGALATAIVLLILAIITTGYAIKKRQEADISGRVSQASLYDAQAASAFDEARRYEARWETARQRHLELKRALGALPPEDQGPTGLRRQNLRHEIQRLDQDMRALSAAAAVPRRQGGDRLKLADDHWRSLERDGHRQALASRTSVNPPHIFSIEVINAGSGESILVHYGTPDATRLVMINAGPIAAFRESVRARLQQLKTQRFDGAPTPIELFVASDQDEHKTGGLSRMLHEQADVANASDRIVELRLIWANMFASRGFRGQIRALMEKLGVPQNKPFDHLIARPDRGQIAHTLPDDLEIIVLGPELARLRNLYEATRRQEERSSDAQREPLAPVIESFPEERFSHVKIADKVGLLPQSPVSQKDDRCAPSENARTRARVTASDMSVPNLASTVLLLRYRGKTFLHTGDSRADLIMEALVSSGLMASDGRAHVSLLHLPHLGSNRNLTSEFLERVTADEYLFSGDGTHGIPRSKPSRR